MSTNLHPSIEAQSEEACIDPAVGSLLPDYIVDLLEEEAAEQVDQHLIDCQTCKEKYLAILRICHTAHEAKIVHGDENGRESLDARVLKLTDYKKRLPSSDRCQEH